MTARPTPQQRAEMAAYIDATEPGWLDELGISRDYAQMSTRDAMKVLIEEWHDANEAGCCDADGPYCDNSKWWARGYLAADLREPNE